MKWDDILLEVAWGRHEESMADKREVETKASFILAGNGVLLGLVVNGFSMLWKPLAFSAVVFIVVSVLFCICSLKIREYRTLKPKRVLKFFEKQEDVTFFKRKLVEELAENEVFNTLQVNKSAGLLQYGLYSFAIAIILTALSLLFGVVALSNNL